jgi:hypothetical protein
VGADSVLIAHPSPPASKSRAPAGPP